MRIGVVSDTHNHLGNVARIVELLNGARVDRVVHTGDITQPKTLEALAGLAAPLVGVYGNNDQEREVLETTAARLDITLVDPPLELHWAERRIVVVHDPKDLGHTIADHHHLALHGHDHTYVNERRGECLVFNPGECAGHMRGYNAVGVVDLVRLRASLLRF